MPEPGFWSRPPDAPGALARLLSPAGAVFDAVGRARRALTRPQRAPVPVICVGNLGVGGAGKTPTATALAQRLGAQGFDVHVVSRGYGGRERGPRRVDARRDTAAQVGDEPLLLAAFATTWVSRDRAAGARAAAEAGAQVVLLDDGFQNPRLAKDLSLVVVDAAAGFGNGRVMPAGPLRETVARGLARADAVVAIGSAEEQAALKARWPAIADRPVLAARIEPLRTGLDLRDAPVAAFAGIGRPEKFFATLRSLGAELRLARAFPDHAVYPPAILRRLKAEAERAGAILVTTEKDAARLPPAFRRDVMALPVRLVFEDEAALDRTLAPALQVSGEDRVSENSSGARRG